MRTTIELDESLHERLRRRAQRDGVAMSRLLGRLVEQGLRLESSDGPPPLRSSGRFRVVAPAEPGARARTEAVQKVIDEEGIL